MRSIVGVVNRYQLRGVVVMKTVEVNVPLWDLVLVVSDIKKMRIKTCWKSIVKNGERGLTAYMAVHVQQESTSGECGR